MSGGVGADKWAKMEAQGPTNRAQNSILGAQPPASVKTLPALTADVESLNHQLGSLCTRLQEMNERAFGESPHVATDAGDAEVGPGITVLLHAKLQHTRYLLDVCHGEMNQLENLA